jgi:hypothetical protein
LSGISNREQEQFVDTLLKLKANLASLENRTSCGESPLEKTTESVAQ